MQTHEFASFPFTSTPARRSPITMRNLTPHQLDRLADAELQQGHVLRAEYLAQQAFALREEGR